MKIINSHYIPMPEPRWLIIAPDGEIYEQIGTLTIVESSSSKENHYGIKTHSHPVVTFADMDSVEETGGTYNISASLTRANGRVLDDFSVDDCFQLCLAKHRKMTFVKFNLLALAVLGSSDPDEYKLEDLVMAIKGCDIKLVFPENELQEIQLTLSDDPDTCMIMSDPMGIFFVVPSYAKADKKGVYLEEDKIFMEFVNQARTYLKINPKYKFHFKTSMDIFKDLVERLNNELNDYLERKED